jgi:urease accessory protein UreF
MFNLFHDLPAPAAEMLNELHRLPAPCWASVSFEWQDAAEFIQRKEARDSRGLELFLDRYFSEVLSQLELPAVQEAFFHSGGCQIRELIALDLRLGAAFKARDLFGASCLPGRKQLKKLRGLRDQRVVQRYLRAVEADQANGLHTVVFGMVLALFSIPLRQGLLYYGGQAVNRLVDSACGSLSLPAKASQSFRLKMLEKLPAEVERVCACEGNGSCFTGQRSSGL